MQQIESSDQVLEYMSTHGPVYGLFLFFLYTIGQQVYKHREEIWRGFSYTCWLCVNLIAEHIRTRNNKFVRKITQDVSHIYANLYAFRELSPIRVQVSKYIYKSKRTHRVTGQPGRIGLHKEEKQVWTCYVMHELPFNGEPVKAFWQGVEIDAQHQEYLVDLIANQESGQLIMAVADMKDGDYKYSLISEGAETVFNIVLAQSQTRVWVLTVMLNREPPLEPEEVSKMKLHAKNIKRLL